MTVYQGKIYVIGGRRDGIETGVNEVYDPATDSWETLAEMPTPRAFLDANVVNGKIYLIGGSISDPELSVGEGTAYKSSNVTEVYDPATDTWTTTPIPYAVSNYVSAVVNNKIYIISRKQTQIYDPETDTWSLGTPPPHQVGLAGGGQPPPG